VQAKKFPSDGTLWENDLQTADTSKCDSGVCDKLKAVLWAFCLLSEHRFFDFAISVYEKQNTNYFIPTFPLFGFFDLQNKHKPSIPGFWIHISDLDLADQPSHLDLRSRIAASQS
jgi:hypothetical protein